MIAFLSLFVQPNNVTSSSSSSERERTRARRWWGERNASRERKTKADKEKRGQRYAKTTDFVQGKKGAELEAAIAEQESYFKPNKERERKTTEFTIRSPIPDGIIGFSEHS